MGIGIGSEDGEWRIWNKGWAMGDKGWGMGMENRDRG